ncbi:MAG: SDR family oxidoreductase [Phycisphaeraceae bacterium]
MKILYIGGTGQISFDCVHESVRVGHEVSVFNRGHHNDGLPPQARLITGDMNDDAAYRDLAAQRFDVVNQFRVFKPDQLRRDIETFAGHCEQYVFISSASAYQKPVRRHVITEAVPLENPYWEYSRNKAACEALLTGQDRLPYTIVRPSHTSRTGWPTASGEGEEVVLRMLEGKPVLVPGDGTSLWTITRGEDFAPPYVKLLGNPKAMGEAFHLTSDNAYMWNEIYRAIARAVGAPEPRLVHVPSETLIRYNPAWEGPLLGDKTWSVVFDNSKIKSVVGDFTCPTTLDQFMQRVAKHFNRTAAEAGRDAQRTALIDRIIAEQAALGAG